MARAWGARQHAYAPYSKFAVGAAVITETGEIFGGCNVENASLGLTICAERVAISTAVAAGFRKFSGMALAADTEEPVIPCGACRQFLAEFHPRLELCCSGRDGNNKLLLLSNLLPSPFLGFQEV